MMSVVDPALCRRVALRYSAALVPITISASALGMCSWWLALDGTALNALLVYRAWQFHEEGDSESARKLFLLTLWHLPVILFL